MIIYKLNEINERISDMNNNIRGIRIKSNEELNTNIDNYRVEINNINNNKNYTEQGKDEIKKNISVKYYDKVVKIGDMYKREIEKEYNSAIERIRELTQYDDERKKVNADKVDRIKENTDLIYSIEVLNHVDIDNTDMLKKLFEEYQENEKILNLIKLKTNKLNKQGINTNDLEDIKSNISALDKDYITILERSKRVFMENEKYPSIVPVKNLEDIFECKKAILDFAQ